MKDVASRQRMFIASFVLLILAVTAQGQQQSRIPSSAEIRAEREEFLSKGKIVTEPPADRRRSWRASLDNGIRKHDAFVETADGSDPTRRDYRFSVAPQRSFSRNGSKTWRSVTDLATTDLWRK